MRSLSVAFVMIAGGMLPACATVVRGTHQDVSIVSEPPQALATLSNGMSCTTPCRLELDRQQDVTVTMTKAGYAASETKIVSRMRGSDYLLGIGGNVLVGGVIGAVVDSQNGALRSLEPSPLKITLQPWAEAAAQTAARFESIAPPVPVAAVQPSFEAPPAEPRPIAQRAVPAQLPAKPVAVRPVMLVAASQIPTCDGMPGVPAGVSTYAIEHGKRFITICDDPARR